MGCDIHAYCEVRKNGKWEMVGAIFPSLYYRPGYPIEAILEEGTEDVKIPLKEENVYDIQKFAENPDWYLENSPITVHPYERRNYSLFALLAGVRNEDYVEPITNPRGLPSDVSEQVLQIAREWGVDGHSHSWFTLGELRKHGYKLTMAAPDFGKAIKLMSELGDPDTVRMVFFFDN